VFALQRGRIRDSVSLHEDIIRRRFKEARRLAKEERDNGSESAISDGLKIQADYRRTKILYE